MLDEFLLNKSNSHFPRLFWPNCSIFGCSPEPLVLIFLIIFAPHHLVSLSQIFPMFSPPPSALHPLSAELLLVIFGFGGGGGFSGSAGICSKAWLLASHWESRQQLESCCWIYLQPTSQLILFVDLRRVDTTFLALALSRWSNKWFENGTRELINWHWNAEEMRQPFRKSHFQHRLSAGAFKEKNDTR